MNGLFLNMCQNFRENFSLVIRSKFRVDAEEIYGVYLRWQDPKKDLLQI
jgi:hypothetical protein